MVLSIIRDLFRTFSTSRRTGPPAGEYQKPRIVRGHHKIETRRWYYFCYLQEASSPPACPDEVVDHRRGPQGWYKKFEYILRSEYHSKK